MIGPPADSGSRAAVRTLQGSARAAHYEVFDPRFDPEPAYWSRLRATAGLYADWSWAALAAQAWAARTPQYVTVLHADDGPCGVVWAAWVGPPTRRHRFALTTRGGRIGGLDVRAPNNASAPGWWFADGTGQRLLTDYAPAMRDRLGGGSRLLLARQLGDTDAAAVSAPLRIVRPTEPISMLDTASFESVEHWQSELRATRRRSLTQIERTVDDDPHLEVRTGPMADTDAGEVATLLRHNAEKHHDVPIVPLPMFTGYLEHLLRQPDVVGVRYVDPVSGALRALALILDHPQWPVIRSWSTLPLHRGGRRNLYFDMYTQAVRFALASGKKGIVLGKKMTELKRTFGARTVAQHAALVPLH
ncbi:MULTISPECIES: GNAT family N-acetyltransferase [Prauserella salsuginis group]|uniref:Uncharacterized protein n=2 Tax=Prauserella salsuginis group TaxID=2893672 RepID=A0A839XWQ3_9PSEU|nr:MULTISPECIES: GNAT family N-acetyltransferase [Prauserella salsuginis group]MBB3664215.1 hypothetical protein [Prauserella sediminis]MCR3721664.1 hypothetical protein [Prauserella flava]MCR3734356.1 hypothetical protein [Prauserella salsuginis]